MELLQEIEKAVTECRSDDVLALTNNSLNAGTPAADIIQHALVPGIREVGARFAQGTYFLPELLVAGQAVQTAISLLEPHLEAGSDHRKGRVLIGTVKGDIHDIGKNIVAMILKCNGWEVTDIGIDADAEAFCQEVSKGNYDLVGLSALLTMTMPAMEKTVKAIRETPRGGQIKIMVGGAPLTQEFADRIGADALGRDAWEAAVKAEALIQQA